MKTRSNPSIVLLCTGLVFILLLLTMIISNRIIVIGVSSGLITGCPGTPMIPFLIQTGLISIVIEVVLTLTLRRFPLKPVGQLINAIHAVAAVFFIRKSI